MSCDVSYTKILCFLSDSRSHSYRQTRRSAAVSTSSGSVDNDSSSLSNKTDSSSTPVSVSSAERLTGGSGLFVPGDHATSGFTAFLMPHIELALKRGFDDNVGRNPVAAIFELTTLVDWAAVAEQLHGMFWSASENGSQYGFGAFRSLTDIDIRFSERYLVIAVSSVCLILWHVS